MEICISGGTGKHSYAAPSPLHPAGLKETGFSQGQQRRSFAQRVLCAFNLIISTSIFKTMGYFTVDFVRYEYFLFVYFMV